MARTRQHLRALPGGPSLRGVRCPLDTLGHGRRPSPRRCLGFLREVVNAQHYGTQCEMDAFLAAAVIPTILFGVFNGALVSALVPVFTDYIAQRARRRGMAARQHRDQRVCWWCMTVWRPSASDFAPIVRADRRARDSTSPQMRWRSR